MEISYKILKKYIEEEFKDVLTKEEMERMQKSIMIITNNEYRKMQNINIEKEDLTYYVFKSIVESKSKYDANRNIPFTSYLNYILKKRLLDYKKYHSRTKRKITLMAINSYRSLECENGQTVFERDVERYSYSNHYPDENDIAVRESLAHFIFSTKSKVDKEVAKCLYAGLSGNQICERLNITKSRFNKAKENMKKAFKGFNN